MPKNTTTVMRSHDRKPGIARLRKSQLVALLPLDPVIACVLWMSQAMYAAAKDHAPNMETAAPTKMLFAMEFRRGLP